MATKDNMFGISGIDRMDDDLDLTTAQMDLSVNGDRSIRNTRRELRRVSATHEAAIDLVAAKEALAVERGTQLVKFVSLKYSEVLETTNYDLKQAEGKEYQRFMEDFTEALRLRSGKQLLATADIAAKIMARQASIPPYPDPEEGVELSWLGRLLFKDK